MLFMATKDILQSILMTAAFVILTDHLFNHESQFCVIPAHLNRIALAADRNGDNIISEEEEEKAIEYLDAQKIKKRKNSKLTLQLSYLNQDIVKYNLHNLLSSYYKIMSSQLKIVLSTTGDLTEKMFLSHQAWYLSIINLLVYFSLLLLKLRVH